MSFKNYLNDLFIGQNNPTMMHIRNASLLRHSAVIYDGNEQKQEQGQKKQKRKEYKELSASAKRACERMKNWKMAEHKKAVYENKTLQAVFTDMIDAYFVNNNAVIANCLYTCADVAIYQFLKYQQKDGERISADGQSVVNHSFNGKNVMTISPITISKMKADMSSIKQIEKFINLVCSIEPSSVEIDKGSCKSMHSVIYHYSEDNLKKLTEYINAYADCTTSIKYADDLRQDVVLAMMEYLYSFDKSTISDIDLYELMQAGKKAIHKYLNAFKRVKKLCSVSFVECTDAEGELSNRCLSLVGIERNASAECYNDGLSRICDYENSIDTVRALRSLKRKVINHIKQSGGNQLHVDIFKGLYAENLNIEELKEKYNIQKSKVYNAIHKTKMYVVNTPAILEYLQSAKLRLALNGKFEKSTLLSDIEIEKIFSLVADSNNTKDKSISVRVVQNGKEIGVYTSISKASTATNCSKSTIAERLNSNSTKPLNGYVFERIAK